MCSARIAKLIALKDESSLTHSHPAKVVVTKVGIELLWQLKTSQKLRGLATCLDHNLFCNECKCQCQADVDVTRES